MDFLTCPFVYESMNLQAALVLVPAGIALYSGVYHLFLYAKSSKTAREGHLPFALVCITIALYDAFCCGLYSSSTPEAAATWQRRQFIDLALLGIFLLWFVSDFVKRTSRILDIIFMSLFAGAALFILVDRSSLSFTDTPMIKQVMLFGRQAAIYNEMKPGIVPALQGGLGVLAIIYIFTSLLTYLLKNPNSSSSAILFGFVVISLAMVNDSLVGNGVYSFIYLIEYSFVILAVSMAYAMACRKMNLESAIISSEREMREIINSVPDIIYALDEHGMFSSVNEAAAKILGVPTSQILGKHFIDFVHPDDKSMIRDTFEKAVTEHAQKPRNQRFRLCNCDGEPVWISMNARMVYGTNNEFIREQGVIRDVRTVRGYEEELQQLAAAVNQADESIIITDRRGVIEYVNPFFEQMTGYPKEEVMGRNTSLLKSGKHSEHFYDELWSTLRAGNTWRGRFTNRKKDGTLFDENAVISPVMNPDGKVMHYVAVKRDITQEVALESQLRESQKMEAIGRLAGGIAHDFTNSLVVILNSAQMAKNRIPADSEAQELLDHVVAAAEKTSSLTSQLLAFSHSHQISPRVMNLNKVISGIDTMIQRMMGSKTNLHIRPSKEPIFVKIDPSQIEQILIHLAVNANDAMPNGGTLTITTSSLRFTKDEAMQIGTANHAENPVFGDMAAITITDSGCGMPTDIQAHAFEPFFTTKGRAKSTGLGLSTVYAIAQKHGGCVDVYSNPGYGTIFTIYLPLADGGTTATDTSSANMPRGKERIMVIEDSMIFRRALVEQLKFLGYSVFEVDEAHTAINSFRKHRDKIDLIITDLIMPQLNGKEISYELREINPDIKVLFTSAYPHDHLVEVNLLSPADPLISKPFSMKEVARTVRQTLDS